MSKPLSRYELGEIMRIHDEQHYRCVDKKYVTKQLEKIYLPPNASRFDVADKVRELERKL